MEGRAEAAPQTRRGASDRVTMGNADLQHLEEGNPRMPHLEFPDINDLDQHFPSLSVPEDVGDDHEVHWDSWHGTRSFNEARRSLRRSTRPWIPRADDATKTLDDQKVEPMHSVVLTVAASPWGPSVQDVLIVGVP